MTSPSRPEQPRLTGCICETTSRWWFMHLRHCPWRIKWADR